MLLFSDDPVEPIPGPQTPLSTYHKIERGSGMSKRDWRLEPRRPVLVVGDSQLERIPPLVDKRVQVDAFPGATLYNGTMILEALGRSHMEVRRVILSFGFNDRSTSTADTFKRNMKHLLDTAGKRFPEAMVFIASIPYSSDLPKPERDKLECFNGIINDHTYRLKSPPPEQVRYGADGIHWSPISAMFIWNHWRNQIFLSS